MFRDDVCIVYQGHHALITEVVSGLRDYNFIFSTWTGSPIDPKYAPSVIFSEIPSDKGPCNFNLQKISTLAGLKECKARGFKYALKIRSDMAIKNIDSFLEMQDVDKINFVAWHYHEVYPNCPGYLIDYLMFGEVDKLIRLWEIEDVNMCAVPEIMLTNSFIKMKEECHYIIDGLTPDNDVVWLKRNLNLSSYRQKYGGYDRYRKYDFGKNWDYLNENYLNFLKK